jgi:hypothetical protein
MLACNISYEWQAVLWPIKKRSQNCQISQYIYIFIYTWIILTTSCRKINGKKWNQFFIYICVTFTELALVQVAKFLNLMATFFSVIFTISLNYQSRIIDNKNLAHRYLTGVKKLRNIIYQRMSDNCWIGGKKSRTTTRRKFISWTPVGRMRKKEKKCERGKSCEVRKINCKMLMIDCLFPSVILLNSLTDITYLSPS